MKKWTKILLVISALLVMSGCGKGKEEASSQAVQSRDYVYSFESFESKLGEREFSQSVVTKDRIVFMEYQYEEVMMPEAREEAFIETSEKVQAEATDEVTEEAAAEEVAPEEAAETMDMTVDMPVEEFGGEYVEPKTTISFLQYDYDLNLLAEFSIEQPYNSGFNGMTVDNAGNIYTVLCEYGKETSTPDVYRDVYTLIGYSKTGEERFRVPLGEDITGDEYYYVNALLCNDTNLFVWGTTDLEVYTTSGELVKEIVIDTVEAGQLLLLRDNSPVLLCYGENGMYFVKIDLKTGELSERFEVPYNGYNFAHYTGTFCDLILVDSVGVYTYNLGEESHKKIMDFVDSDMVSNSCYSIAQISEESFFAWTYDEESDSSLYGIFSKVDPSTIKDKEVLTLGIMWMDFDVRKRVVEFNKASDTYRIHIEEYSQYNTAEDYTLGLSRLNTDIASGNAPDIMCVTGEMPVESYMSKGLFVDLKTFMEKDPELKIEDYMPEVIDAFSQDGKWYQMVPTYYLFTVFGKTADVGEEAGWTFEDMQALRKKKGEDVQVFSERTKLSVLNDAIMMNSDEYIDWETGDCYFNTQEFIDLLEFANEFPDEIDYEELYEDESYWESQETMFREGKTLLMPYTISDFRDFLYCEDGTFGEQITAVGFPVGKGVGNAYMSNLGFCISTKSKNQDVAWEFIRYYLTDEYQDALEYGWPVKLSSLEKRVEKAKQRPYYEDGDGNKVEYDETFYLNGMEIVLEPLTQEDCDRVIGFLKSADHIYSFDRNIITILEEECAAFFAGQKSAKEVADIIQSRIHIYVNENL